MRESYAETQIPTAVASVPYADHKTLIRGILKHNVEAFYGTVTCENPIGDLVVATPFDPSHVVVFRFTEAGAPVKMEAIAGMTVEHGMKTIAAGTFSLITSLGITLGTKQFTIGQDTGIQVATAVLRFVAYGARDVNGSL